MVVYKTRPAGSVSLKSAASYYEFLKSYFKYQKVEQVERLLASSFFQLCPSVSAYLKQIHFLAEI